MNIEATKYHHEARADIAQSRAMGPFGTHDMLWHLHPHCYVDPMHLYDYPHEAKRYHQRIKRYLRAHGYR